MRKISVRCFLMLLVCFVYLMFLGVVVHAESSIYRDEDVTVSVDTSNSVGLEGTSLEVKKIEGLDCDGLFDGLNIGYFLPYDISFIRDGVEVQPESGYVIVTMDFLDGLSVGTGEKIKVAHIISNGVLEYVDCTVDGSSISFRLSSFSIVGPVTISEDDSTDEGTYALLYDSGVLVFQVGSEPDDSLGTVVETYSDFIDSAYGHGSTPWYNDRLSVTEIVVKDGVKPISTNAWFADFTNLTKADLSGLDVANDVSMWRLFYKCSSLTDITFGDSIKKANKLLSLRDTFNGCSSLMSVDLASWYVNNVTDYSGIFTNCTNMRSVNLSGWKTTKGTNFSSFFSGCQNLARYTGVADLDVSNANNMDSMFNNNKALTELDLSSWKTPKATSFQYFFNGCEKLVTLDISNLDVSNASKFTNMFGYCGKLTNLKANLNVSKKATSLSGMFVACYSLTDLDISSWDTQNVTNMTSVFKQCNSVKALDVSGWNTANVTNMYALFQDCYKLTELDVSGWKTDKVTSMELMFQNVENVPVLDVSNWNTSNVSSMGRMFNGDDALVTLDVSGWDVSNVNNMDRLFSYCSGLTVIDTSGWVTSSLTYNSYRMFYDCSGVLELDLSGFDTTMLSEYKQVFSGMDSLRKVVLGENFSFHNDSSLPSGTWVRESTLEKYTADELKASYDGSTMADTYYRVVDITFDGNGGLSSNKTVQGCVGLALDTLPTATKNGGYFDGWWTDMVGGTELVDGDVLTQDTYYAHWSDYGYTLVLKPNGGEGSDISIDLGYNTIYQLRDTLFEREGMKIIGWNTRKDDSGEAYLANEEVLRMSTEDGETVILYAIWGSTEDLVTVSFDSVGGTAVPDMEVVKGSYLGTLSESSKDGATFVGWHIGSADGVLASSKTKVNQDMVLVAEWVEDSTVTFDTCVDSISNTEKVVKYNRAVGELPSYTANADRPMSLIGWFTKEVGGTKVSSDTVITGDVTYYAHWGWKPILDTNGGYFTTDVEYQIQEDSTYVIADLPDVSRDGYFFDGWYLDDGTEVQVGDTVDLSKGAVITAKWVKDKVITVDCDMNGGQFEYTHSNKVLSVYAGKPVLDLPVPTRTGYNFIGWADADGNMYDRTSVFYEDTYLTAVWEMRSAVVTFDACISGIDDEIVEVPYGGTIDTLPGVKRENYILDGWYTGKNGTGEKLTTETEITEECTYYANWIPLLVSSDDADTTVYDFGIEWSNASNENVDNVDGVLNFHPTTNTTQTAQMHIRFELTKTTNNSPLPVGSVNMTVPKYIFEDWDGNPIGENNISAMLAEYPNVQDGMYFSYIDMGDYVVITNSRVLSGGTGLDFTISYQVTPSEVNGGAIDANGNYVDGYNAYKNTVPVTISIDADLDGNAESIMEDDLSVEMHTQVVESAKKQESLVYYSWNSRWGKEPSDSGNYFYVEWYLYSTFYSSTCQPYTYVWSEDTVHDGTVMLWGYNGSWYSEPVVHDIDTMSNTSTSLVRVIVKYPISMLADMDEYGLELDNEAVLTVNWKSGYVSSERVSDSVIIYDVVYPKGTFSKTNTYGRVHAISGGQETLMDDNEEVTMKWALSYIGDGADTAVWDEEHETYSVTETTIDIIDGVSGDVMYSSGGSRNKYVWEPVTGNITLSDEDYYFSTLDITLSEYDSRMVDGVWLDSYLHSEVSDYKPVEVWVRYKNTDDFYFYQNVYVGNGSVTVALPSDVVGFEIRHNSAFYSTDMRVEATMNLKTTHKVLSLIGDDAYAGNTSIIKNIANCNVWDTALGSSAVVYNSTNYSSDGNANNSIYELDVSSTYQYTKKWVSSLGNVVLDVERGTQDNPVSISAWNYNNSGRKKYIQSGTFYDLLPEGTTVDVSTVFGIPITSNLASNGRRSNIANDYTKYSASNSKLTSGYYDVRFVEDWEDSGRTMMIISYTVPSDVDATGVDFFYMLHNTYENIVQNGTTLENDVAFVNTTSNSVMPSGVSDGLSVITDSEYFESLDNMYSGKIGYAKASTNYAAVDAFSWGFTKMVKYDSNYETDGEVLSGRTYTYKLSYSQSDYAYSTNLVFFDVLESGTVGRTKTRDTSKSAWYGVFSGIDVSEIASLENDGVNCSPVVYYSTKARDSFGTDDYDVSNTDTWSTVAPSDLSLVTAVAVDCRYGTDGKEFGLEGRQVLNVYITMTAPSLEDLGDDFEGSTSYNEGVVTFTTNAGTESTMTSNASTTLVKDQVEIHKSSVVASGTEAEPTKVYQDDVLTYTLEIRNDDSEISVTDVLISEQIPAGLTVTSADIKVHFNDEEGSLSVSQSPRVSLTRFGNALGFKISSLLPNEIAYIEIPCLVTGKSGVLENTAKITSVDGVEELKESETTWHEIIPTGIQIQKTGVKGVGVVGAELHLLDSDNNEVDRWVSDGRAHSVDVKVGRYLLEEISAPDGYLLADDVVIEVSRTGEAYVEGKLVNTVTMRDDYTKVYVKKLDTAGNMIEGATLAFYKDSDVEDGAVVDGATPVASWETVQGVEHGVLGVLEAGSDYYLVELSAPDGYAVAEPVLVTVDSDGSEQHIEMVDEATYHTLKVSKTVTGNMGNKTREFGFSVVINGYDSVEYKKTSSDGSVSEGTMNAENGAYSFKLSNGECVEFLNIKYGTDYKVVETGSAGYTVSCDNLEGTVVGDTEVNVVNSLNVTVPTFSSMGRFSIILLVWAVVCVVYVVVHRRHGE